MRFVIDENISREIIDRLRIDGHTLYKISDHHQGVMCSYAWLFERDTPVKHPLITTNPNIEGGKPIIKGTRITIEMLANEYMAGRTVEQLHYSYPHLTHEQIEAALAYAADMKVTSVLTD